MKARGDEATKKKNTCGYPQPLRLQPPHAQNKASRKTGNLLASCYSDPDSQVTVCTLPAAPCHTQTSTLK